MISEAFNEEEGLNFNTQKVKSTGGSSSYWRLPKWAKELGDLINFRNMNFNIGNIFKACYRFGEKEGIDLEYDLNKIIFFANMEKKRLGLPYDHAVIDHSETTTTTSPEPEAHGF